MAGNAYRVRLAAIAAASPSPRVMDNRSEGIAGGEQRTVRTVAVPRLEIDGVPYEVGRYRTSLARPVDAQATPNEAALRFEYRFAAPDPETPTVTRLDPCDVDAMRHAANNARGGAL